MEKYYSDVWYYTNKSYKEHKDIINPENKRRGYTDHHLDHKISILFGYINNIGVELIGHQCNLEVIPYKENLAKQAKCSITLEELLEKIKGMK